MVESGASQVDAVPELDRALQGLRDLLGADGYRLGYAVQSGRELVVSVLAGPDACAECLVPKQVMEGIVTDALQGTEFTVNRVEMPAEQA
jgi:hypothetical protein